MAVNETTIASWSGGTGYSRTEAYESGRNNAAGWVDVYWWVGSRGTWGSVSGTWDWSRGGSAGGAGGSVGAATGTRGVQSSTTRIYCDANGNYSNFSVSMYWDMFYGQGTATTTIGFDRSPLAPPIVGQTADNIAVSNARLGVEIGSLGHGTSVAMRMYYRIQGSGSGWTATSDQADASGYNYWTITGLKQATTYEYFARVWNNMGDTSDGSTQTFKTKSATNLLASLIS